MNIDWSHPSIDAVRDATESNVAVPLSVAQILNSLDAEHMLRFVPQDALPESEAYEAFIYRTGLIPTRNNAHDFFNGLMWLSMPQTKRALNVLQATQIAQEGIKQTRGTARDAATLFDENGAVLVTHSRALLAAWQARDWQRLFVALCEEWMHAKLLIFGHATLEKCLQPYKAITTHTLWLDAPPDTPQAQVDALLAQSVDRIAKKDWQPLPMMGVPGWWPNELGPQDAAFYADTKVFRR